MASERLFDARFDWLNVDIQRGFGLAVTHDSFRMFDPVAFRPGETPPNLIIGGKAPPPFLTLMTPAAACSEGSSNVNDWR